MDYKYAKNEGEEIFVAWDDQDLSTPARIFENADDAVEYVAEANDASWADFE